MPNLCFGIQMLESQSDFQAILGEHGELSLLKGTMLKLVHHSVAAASTVCQVRLSLSGSMVGAFWVGGCAGLEFRLRLHMGDCNQYGPIWRLQDILGSTPTSGL